MKPKLTIAAGAVGSILAMLFLFESAALVTQFQHRDVIIVDKDFFDICKLILGASVSVLTIGSLAERRRCDDDEGPDE